MQITIKGELSLKEIAQAIHETLGELQIDFAIRHSHGATLFVNPIDDEGRVVIARQKDGRIVTKLLKNGPYRSAAEQFNI